MVNGLVERRGDRMGMRHRSYSYSTDAQERIPTKQRVVGTVFGGSVEWGAGEQPRCSTS